MGPDHKALVPQWLLVARRDWERVLRNLHEGDAGAAAFFLQQCLEKYLKAFLLTHGWELKKIHPLYTLLDEAVRHKRELDVFYDVCEAASGYYVAERYPPFGAADLPCEEIEALLGAAWALILALFPDEDLGA
jgi:HEPN domain-containing protein